MKKINLILATTNKIKINEVKDIINNSKYKHLFTLRAIKSECDETKNTYNAIAKQKVCKALAEFIKDESIYNPNSWIMTDDSGIEIEELGVGVPGIHTKRYGGAKNSKEAVDIMISQLTNKLGKGFITPATYHTSVSVISLTHVPYTKEYAIPVRITDKAYSSLKSEDSGILDIENYMLIGKKNIRPVEDEEFYISKSPRAKAVLNALDKIVNDKIRKRE